MHAAPSSLEEGRRYISNIRNDYFKHDSEPALEYDLQMLSLLHQVQATVVGLLAAVAAILLGAISKGYVELNQAAVLCASSVTIAFVAALSLGESPQLHLTFQTQLDPTLLFKVCFFGLPQGGCYLAFSILLCH